VKSSCALLAIGLALVGYWYFHRPITYPPGVLIASEPEQIDVVGSAKPIDYRAFHLQPLAHFTIDARWFLSISPWAGARCPINTFWIN
jgi:hypothetical protein